MSKAWRVVAIIVVVASGAGAFAVTQCDSKEGGTVAGAPPESPKDRAVWAVAQARESHVVEHLETYSDVAGFFERATRILDYLLKVKDAADLLGKVGDPKALFVELGWKGLAAIVSSAVVELTAARELRRYIRELSGYSDDLKRALGAAERDPGPESLAALAAVAARGTELVSPIHGAVGGLRRFVAVVADVIGEVRTALDDCAGSGSLLKAAPCWCLEKVASLAEFIIADGALDALRSGEGRVQGDLEALRLLASLR